MDKRYILAAFLVFALIFSLSVTDVYAFDHGKAKGGYCRDKAKGGHWDLESKFTRKAGLFLKNKEELGLSDGQVKKIKDLKLRTKKDLIRKKAEIKIIALDIKAEMREGAVDTAEIGKLIDKKYDLKKEKEKSLVGAYAALKGILTKEQKEKMKDLWKECKKGKTQKHR